MRRRRRRCFGSCLTRAIKLGVVDFRRDREARNQLVSYVKSESVGAFFFVSALTVQSCLVGELGGETCPSCPIAFPGTEEVTIVRVERAGSKLL